MAIGNVLRNLGSVLNPAVAQELGLEERMRQQQEQQLGMFQLQQQAAGQRLQQEQDFVRAENAKRVAAQFELHQADLKQKAADRLAIIEETARQGRITREEADARAAMLRKEMQERELAAREQMARLVGGMRPPPQPQLVTNESGVFQVGRDGRATPVVGPDNQPLPGKAATPQKALPTSAAQKLFENQQNLRRAEQALALLKGKGVGTATGDPEATGWKGFLPDAILQRVDPKGVDTRAAIADLGSLVIHDRSGAAVTAAEFPRLRPFIPTFTDDAETAKKKVKRFKEVYQSIVDETRNFYIESGYRVPELSSSPAPKSVPDVPAPPPGFKED